LIFPFPTPVFATPRTGCPHVCVFFPQVLALLYSGFLVLSCVTQSRTCSTFFSPPLVCRFLPPPHHAFLDSDVRFFFAVHHLLLIVKLKLLTCSGKGLSFKIKSFHPWMGVLHLLHICILNTSSTWGAISPPFRRLPPCFTKVRWKDLVFKAGLLEFFSIQTCQRWFHYRVC